MSEYWTQPSGTSLGTLQERVTVTINLPISGIDEVTLISGELPQGLRLQGTQIVGTPYEVAKTTQSRFVLRAVGIVTEDRTYNITVEGADAPVWQTAEGLIPVGRGGTYFILDSEPVDFQLSAIDPDLPAGDELEFFIRPGGGELPPGVQLTTDGRLVGIVDPLLALDKIAGQGFYDDAPYDLSTAGYDFSVLSNNGFSSFFYDSVYYDYAENTRIPKKLNRYYEFEVSVTDGEVEVRRKFKIYVVGDDFLRADNTITKVANGLFTADNTFLRTPIWVTPANLGYRRADNFITEFLDVIDTNTLAGQLSFILLSTNPDSTNSELPPGMQLDGVSGEIAGRVPYQPAVTKAYKFTVRAQRTFDGDQIEYRDKTFTLNILGEVDSTITWISDASLGSIAANFTSTLSVQAETTILDAPLLYRVTSGRLPPGLTLSYDGEIIGKVRQFGIPDAKGLTVFDNGELTFDGASTSVDRSYTFTAEARDRFGYSASTKTFTISVIDEDDKLYSNLIMKPFLNSTQRTAYRNFVSNPTVFPPDTIYRPNDPVFGLQKEIKILVYAGLETKDIENYVAASAKNHKKKRYKIGELKTAVAKNAGSNDIVYEVVYLELIDPTDGETREKYRISNNKEITVDSRRFPVSDAATVIYPDNRNTIKSDSDAVKVSDPNDVNRYVSNITNMRKQLTLVGDTELGFLPLWMRTAQQNSIQELGFTLCIPLVYCKEGTAGQIKLNIENSGFDFKTLDITTDRYIIDSTTGSSDEQYIVFANYQFNI